jgi:tetratricopeptide (TPR) repeat protein
MDEALHESGAGDSFESILVSPSEGTAQTEHDSGLLQELQDQLGPDFDPDADLEGGNQRKKSQGRRRKKSSAAIMQGTPLPGRLSTTFGKANTAYTLGQYQESIRLFHEIIKEAPQASQPWAQVAMIYDELGETLKSLQAYLIAAHLIKTDADLWRRIGEMSLYVLFLWWYTCIQKKISVHENVSGRLEMRSKQCTASLKPFV